ncbi:MAG: hypothetical protein HYS13_17340, partial [Planctomycetia bacterium]|nr:hypothetical protein [Planctomycetia bacterium]
FVEEQNGRVLYPCYQAAPVRGALREILGIRPRQANGYFLFRGKEPFDLNVYIPQGYKVAVRPRVDRITHQQLLGMWWSQYTPGPRLLESAEDYPPVLENYLQCMLSRRLGLAMPDQGEAWLATVFNLPKMDDILGPLAGTESLKIELQRETMLGAMKDGELADLPLPAMPEGPPLLVPDASADVAVEPIAMHVPEECFYVRCGSFGNFIWLRKTLEQTGGDLANLLALRGVNYSLSDKLQRQLVLKESELARLVVADVAWIGTDPFLREGGATGVVFEANNLGASLALAGGIKQQRQAALADQKEAVERMIDVAGRQVSFISTPDNRVRSFYAIDGNYHLVTTSRYIVGRFYEAGEGTQALGASAEFLNARSLLPVARGDTVFFYASDAFFENLASPRYRVEMLRRLRAAGNLELARMARLAAKAEHVKADTLDDLIVGGFLPPSFGDLPGGSRTLLRGDLVLDSARGARGTFLPVPDIEFTTVTPSEARQYRSFIRDYRETTGRMDPIALAVQRYPFLPPPGAPPLPPEAGLRELIVIDARISPFTHGGSFFQGLGPPSRRQLRRVPGDVLSAEVVYPDQHAFSGLRDLKPPESRYLPLQRQPRTVLEYVLPYVAMTPPDYLFGYVGGTSGGAVLDEYITDRFGPPQRGLARGDGFWYRLESGGYTTYSFHPEILRSVGPQLVMEDAPRPAQMRLHVGDLAQTNLARLLDMMGFLRARQASDGNTALLNAMAQQLHLPREEALPAAEAIIDARLVCPQGGKYVLAQDKAGYPRWQSTAGREFVEGRYRFPPLGWLRGLDVDVAVVNGTLAAHVEVDMHWPAGSDVPPPPPPAARPKPPEELPPPKPAEKKPGGTP